MTDTDTATDICPVCNKPLPDVPFVDHFCDPKTQPPPDAKHAAGGEREGAGQERYPCPVCLWKTLKQPADIGNLCPCCGTEYGGIGVRGQEVDYAGRLLTDRRAWWLSVGGKWWSPFRQPIPEFIECQLGG